MVDFVGGLGFGGANPQILQQLQRRALSQGLLQAGAGLLQAGGPSPVPIGFGQALGAGLQGFGQGAIAGGQAFQNEQLRGLQIQAAQAKLQQQQRQQEALAALQRRFTDQSDDTGPGNAPGAAALGLAPGRAELFKALLPLSPKLATTLITSQKPKARTLSAAEKRTLGIPNNVVAQQLPDGRVDIAFKPEKETQPKTPINILQPDGTVRAFRPGDPGLDAALNAGGTVVSQRAQAETPGALTKTRADDVRADINSIQRARTKISEIRAGIEANRGRAGLTGTVRNLLQRGASIAGDVAGSLGIDLGGFVRETAETVRRDLNSGIADPAIGGLFDPELPANQVRENSLAYALARARKGTGRLNAQDVENARKDVSITGLKSVDEVLARLKEIDAEFAEAETDRQSRLRGSSSSSGNSTGRPRFRIENGRLVRER